jgi:hypothetical protein
VPTVIDTFAGLAAGSNLSTRSPWVQRSGVLQGGVGGASVSPNNPSADSVYAYGGTWGADQFAECAVTRSGSTPPSIGPAVRVGPTGDCYALIVSENGTAFLNKYSAGVFSGPTLFTSAAGAIASGSVVRISAVGTTIKAFDDGVEIASVTDASFATGNPGLAGFNAGGLVLATQWQASDGRVEVTPAIVQRRKRQARPHDRSASAWFEGPATALAWFDKDLWRVASTGGITANLSATDAQDAIASTASLSAAAALLQADGSDALSSVASAAVTAAFVRTDDADTITAAGAVQALGLNALLNATDGADVVISAASLAVTAALGATDQADTLASGSTAQVSATLARTDGDDRITATATSISALTAALVAVDGNDSMSSAGSASIGVALSATDSQDQVASAASIPAAAALVAVDASDAIAAAASLQAAGALVATDGDDALISAASLSAVGGLVAALAITDAADSLESAALLGEVVAEQPVFGGGGDGATRIVRRLTRRASVVLTDGGDTLVSAGVVIPLPLRVEARIADGQDVLSAAAELERYYSTGGERPLIREYGSSRAPRLIRSERR